MNNMTNTTKLNKTEWKALVNAAADLIDDPRSAYDLGIEFGVPTEMVRELQADLRVG